MNQEEIIKHNPRNLKAGVEVPFLTKKIKVAAGKYEEGQIIEYDTTTKKGNKCTTLEKFYGISTDKFTVEDNEEITVYLSGIFYEKAIVKEKSIAIEDLEKTARPFNIYFR